ncbi:MAG: DUF294 nucleotidyltransferase-like domain-containing protein [Wenzhouxiangellaceae bacterium]|nr:DUF294 nucleotidyltransferase-like domain-containing protein [Wenzhouxiangellaceae bacterium]
MEVEQIEIRENLRQHPPFELLTEQGLDEVAANVEVTYYRSGSPIVSIDDRIGDLHYIRSGSVEIYRRGGEIQNRLGEGEVFGQLGVMTGKPARYSVRALEDSLIYFIPGEVFKKLLDEQEAFADYLELEDRARLRQAASVGTAASEFMTTRVGKLISREPVMVPEATSIQEAAIEMAEYDVSSLVIYSGSPPVATQAAVAMDDQQVMTGIVTNSDLVKRVLARGLAHDRPVSEVMSSELVTVEEDSFLFEALLMMLRKNIKHLPVLHRGRPAGVIDLSDVVSHETQNSLFVVRSIFQQNSVDELKALLPDVSACFVRMVREDANSHMIGSAIAAIGRSFKQRLLELGQEALGPPPVPYCFLALGSMARDEQFMYTDQDNAMVLHDDYDPKLHGKYFSQLATFVCDGLAQVGYRYCKGGIMATNDRWRIPLAAWKKTFEQWIEKPKPEALLHSSIFFDLDGVHGATRMADELKALISSQASQSPRFLGCLARNAQNRTPPLGFFKDFVLEKSGRYQETLNLKRRGTGPLVDVIRVHALASASLSQNSFRRLEDVLAAGFLTSGMTADLRDALEFIAIIRARHQAADIETGRRPNNNVDPESLSRLERRSLKDAFNVLSNAQKFLKFRYRP